MDHLKKYMLSLVVLALLVVIVAPFRFFFMANIIQPIAVICWALWRIVASVDQNMYWMMLILVCSILVIRLIPNRNENASNMAYKYTYKSYNRVEHWKTLITDAVVGKQEAEALRDSIKKLLVSSIPQIEGADPMDLEEKVAIGKIPLSPQAHRFLFPPERSARWFSLRPRFKLIFLIPKSLRRSAAKFIQRDTTSLGEILEWIETETETRNDR